MDFAFVKQRKISSSIRLSYTEVAPQVAAEILHFGRQFVLMV